MWTYGGVDVWTNFVIDLIQRKEARRLRALRLFFFASWTVRAEGYWIGGVMAEQRFEKARLFQREYERRPLRAHPLL